jgi:translation elongation factor P/translation initiation factor 5A
MATTADFKNGLCLEFNNDIFTIVQFQHVKPGKGPAFVRDFIIKRRYFGYDITANEIIA